MTSETDNPSVIGYDSTTATLTLSSSTPIPPFGDPPREAGVKFSTTRLVHVQVSLLLEQGKDEQVKTEAKTNSARDRSSSRLFEDGAWITVIGYVTRPVRDTPGEAWVQAVLALPAKGRDVGGRRYEEAVRARARAGRMLAGEGA